MTIRTFTCNPFATNTYVAIDGGESIIVDASPQSEDEIDEVMLAASEGGASPRHLLLTHAHIDHVMGAAVLAERLGLKWQMDPAEAPLLARSADQAAMFGLPAFRTPDTTDALRGGDAVAFGSRSWQVLSVPGHSPGSLAFYDTEAAAVISGDALFRRSIGRTDLPLGDLPTLLRAIETQLLTLPPDTRVLPGHGPPTTIGEEARLNPFLT
jgi:glyoxylase-like metal-dependent hydrolase (beta-lactamase superfamily II)